MKSTKGITLVALVITIIILLILAGITIMALTGGNGLIEKVTKAKLKYNISEAKEKLELAIMDLRADVEGKGEQLTKEKLLKLNNEEIDVKSTEKFPVETICTDYIFDIDSNYNVIYKGKANGIKVEYTIEPEGYTNQDEIIIYIKVKSFKGIKTIEYPNGNILEANGQKEIQTQYTVNKNGEYNFIITDKENTKETRKIYVEKIDKIAPKDFTPEGEPGSGSVTITCNAEDEEATEESCKSGIDYYEYYIKKNTDTNYPQKPSESNIITGLEPGIYNIYAIVYDKAGNKKQSQEIKVEITIKISKVATALNYSFAIDENSHLWGWGYNSKVGYLAGTGHGKDKKIMNSNVKFQNIEACSNAVLALDNEGNIWDWGSGDGTTNSSSELKRIVSDTKFTQITCGAGASFAIDIDGNIWAWGKNTNGLVLGTGKYGDESKPVQITNNVKFKKISSGQGYTLALDEEGNLWSWGQNTYGKLADSTQVSKNVPTKVENGIKYKEISAGYDCSLLIDENNTLWGCGYNKGGFGNGTGVREQVLPTKIKEELKFIKAVSNNGDCFILDENGNLWAWGVNEYGEIGQGTNNQRVIPEIIKNEIKFTDITTSIALGYGHILTIDENGELWGCGSNSDGVIGNATQYTGTNDYTGKLKKVF